MSIIEITIYGTFWFTLYNCFMLVSVSLDPEPIPETLSVRPVWMGRQSITVRYAHICTLIHTQGQFSVTSSQRAMRTHQTPVCFWEETEESHAAKESYLSSRLDYGPWSCNWFGKVRDCSKIAPAMVGRALTCVFVC